MYSKIKHKKQTLTKIINDDIFRYKKSFETKGGENMRVNTSYLFVLIAGQKLTLAQLSKSSGVSRTTIWKVLNGKVQPNTDTIGKIAAALEVSPADIIEK